MLSWKQFKDTMAVRAFAFFKVPLLFSVRPTVLQNSIEKTVVKIPLCRKTKNHLNVMYFGALTIGGEAAVGLGAVQAIEKSGKRIDFLFKDFKADFRKRAEGDVHFVCEQGPEVLALIEKCVTSGQRENQTFKSFALVPSVSETEHVADFEVTLSVKLRQKK